MDRIGLDVIADIEQAYAEHLGDAAEAAPPFLLQMIREGKLGVKAGVGFYRYPDPAFERDDFLDATPIVPSREDHINVPGASWRTIDPLLPTS